MTGLFINSSVQNGLHLHLCNTAKFKTINLILMLKVPLQEELTTARALIPYILTGGTINYPNRKLMKQKLEEMYGAKLSLDVLKKGDYHLFLFSMEIPEDQYLNVSSSLLESALLLLHEIVYSPMLEHGVFHTAIVEQEKRSLQQQFSAMYNEKMLYAHFRLIEEMFKGEPYQLSEFGREQDLASLTALAIYQAYEDLLQYARFDLFIVGAFNEKEAQLMVRDIFSEQHYDEQVQVTAFKRKGIKGVKVIQDKMDVKQGKLLLGYRTFSTVKDADYDATSVANAIFGRFPTSKLFRNVREKESLAYFAHSQMDSSKGLLVTMAGIDFDNYKHAVEMIREQEYAMKNGSITATEIEHGKTMLINLIQEAQDTPLGIIDICIQGVDRGLSDSISDQISKIREISKSDIICAANKWELDTIYFLNGKE